MIMIGYQRPLADSYTEYASGLIAPSPMKKVFRNLLLTSGILLLIYTVLFYPILWTFSLLFFVWAYYYNRSLKYEIEYLIYNDDIHIDKIVANLKRKRKFAGNLQHLKLFTDDPAKLNDYRHSGQKMKTHRLNNNQKKTYAMVFHSEEGLECVYVNASDEMIELIRKRAPISISLKKTEEEKNTKV